MRVILLVAVVSATLVLTAGRLPAHAGAVPSASKVVDQTLAYAPAASRLIDRTFVCTTVLQAGIRQVRIAASSAATGQKDHLGQQAQPFLQLTTGGTLTDGSLAGMSAGPSTRRWRATLWVGSDRCRSLSRRPALTRAGLRGGPASPFGEEIECESPPIVVVRVRGLFGSPARLRQVQSGLLTTSTTLREGSLSIETPNGKRLIYADVREPMNARLFVARGCTPR